MKVTGEALFISVKSGAKNGKSWHAAKFLDESADEFFIAFIGDELAADLQGTVRKTPVTLTLNLVPGQKYFSIEAIELE